MLERARAKFPNLVFLQGDACAVPLEEKFDHACLAFGPRNIHDLDKLWKEMQRLVRPGGRILSLELTRPKGLLGLLHRFYLEFIVPLVGKLLSGDAEAYGYLSNTIAKFLDAQELAQTMRSAGLVDVRIVPLLGGIATLHVGTVP
jgi:demethylmenaquinone methyltransferase/2-methoxy-6-polyprenyl-1,4-benzoquinol methylase